MTTTIFQQKIITMDPSRPEATHVAVKEGRILGVGGWQSLRLGEPTVSTSGLQIKF